MSKKVLVADDNPDLLNTLVRSLKNEGLQIFSANNGKDALELALQNQPDLLIIDEMMPEMTGLQVVEEIRKTEWGTNVPVIMLTNVENTSEVNNALKFGVSDYLIKSDIHLEQLKNIIKQKLN